jgi:hypothetical protein
MIALRDGRIREDENDDEFPRRYRTTTASSAFDRRAARYVAAFSLAVTCLLVALSVGIHRRAAATTTSSEDGGGGEIIDSSSTPPPNSQHSGALDAILNSLRVFDPVWYDRRSGWEVRARNGDCGRLACLFVCLFF